jgi:hypothetical protein
MIARKKVFPIALGLLFTSTLPAQTSTMAGEFTAEPPTLTSLGFEWRITGDDNRTATVETSYRKKGESNWRPALPLMRLQREEIGTAPGQGAGNAGRYQLFRYIAANMFAGSILNLDADTEYECRFVLSDPDGVTGNTERVVTMHTRGEPTPSEGGHTYHVYPVGWTGAKQEPAFTGLIAAYYMGLAHFDYENAFPPRVQPGDTILVHAGLYVGDRFHYMNGAPRPGYLAMGNVFDGTYYLTQSGTAEKPIVIKVYGQGHVVAYNYIANWHDGVDVATYGTPDGAPNDIPDRVPLAIDFYGNDIVNMGDNCFETDGGARNIRVFRNRCFDSAAGALSVQLCSVDRCTSTTTLSITRPRDL